MRLTLSRDDCTRQGYDRVEPFPNRIKQLVYIVRVLIFDSASFLTQWSGAWGKGSNLVARSEEGYRLKNVKRQNLRISKIELGKIIGVM